MEPTLWKSTDAEQRKLLQDFSAFTSDRKTSDSRQMLMWRQCGEDKGEIFRERKSGLIRGCVLRNGGHVFIDVCGLPRKVVEEEKVPLVRRCLEEAIVTVREGRIDVRPRLLGGMDPENGREISGEVVADYKNIRNEDIDCLKRGLEGRLGGNEQIPVHEMELDRLLEGSIPLDVLAELMVSSNENVSIRTAEVLTGSLKAEIEKDENIVSVPVQKVLNFLRLAITNELANGAANLLRLERYTRVLGLALAEIAAYCAEKSVTKFLKLERAFFYKLREELNARMGDRESFDIRYNLAFILEGAKRLRERESSTTQKYLEKAAKISGNVIKHGLSPISASIGAAGPVPTASVGVKGDDMFTNLQTACQKIRNVKKDPDWNKWAPWYEATIILMKSGSSAKKDIRFYSQQLNKPEFKRFEAEWQWHYAKIVFIKRMIKEADEHVRERALKDFAVYRDPGKWNKLDYNTKMVCCGVQWELFLDVSTRRDLIQYLSGNETRTSGNGDEIELEKQYSARIKVEMESEQHWRDVSAKRKEADKWIRAKNPMPRFVGPVPSSQGENEFCGSVLIPNGEVGKKNAHGETPIDSTENSDNTTNLRGKNEEPDGFSFDKIDFRAKKENAVVAPEHGIRLSMQQSASSEKLKIFISAHSTSAKGVSQFKERFLNQLNVLDSSPKVGENIQEAIRQKVEVSDFMVFFVTKDYLKSEDCMCQATMLRSLVLKPLGKNVYEQKMHIVYDQEIVRLKDDKLACAVYVNECCQKWNKRINDAVKFMANPKVDPQVQRQMMGGYLNTLCDYREEIVPFIKDDVFAKYWFTLERLEEQNFQPLGSKIEEILKKKQKNVSLK